MELRTAALVVFDNQDNVKEVMVFDDHNDAVDVFGSYLDDGTPCVLSTVTHYEQGQMPPNIQKKMKLK